MYDTFGHKYGDITFQGPSKIHEKFRKKLNMPMMDAYSYPTFTHEYE